MTAMVNEICFNLNIYLSSPLRAGGFSGIIKQIIQMEHNMVKYSDFEEANEYRLFYKRGTGFEHGTTENKPSKRLGRDLNSMHSDFGPVL